MPPVDPLAGASIEDLVHLVRAIQTYRIAAIRSGQSVPVGLLAIEHSVSLRAIGSQSAPLVGEATVARNAEQVNPLLVSYSVAAQRLSFSPRTLTRRIAAGEIVPVRSGRIARIRVADLDAFVTANQGVR